MDLSDATLLKTNAQLNVLSGGQVLAGSNSFISADWGTTTTINAGGTLEINGSGGYYQGSAIAGQPLGKLVNNGLLSKTGGGTTSIVEATTSKALQDRSMWTAVPSSRSLGRTEAVLWSGAAGHGPRHRLMRPQHVHGLRGQSTTRWSTR